MAILTIVDEHITLDVPNDTSLLDLSEEQDTGLIFGCTAGHCAICMVTVLKGVEHLSPINDTERYTLTQDELKANFRLACQTRILGGCVHLSTS